MNKKSEKFADLCALKNVVIGGSRFPNRKIQQETSVLLDHLTVNLTDHICITKKFCRSLQDVGVKRGEGMASDHQLLLAKLKFKPDS